MAIKSASDRKQRPRRALNGAILRAVMLMALVIGLIVAPAIWFRLVEAYSAHAYRSSASSPVEKLRGQWSSPQSDVFANTFGEPVKTALEVEPPEYLTKPMSLDDNRTLAWKSGVCGATKRPIDLPYVPLDLRPFAHRELPGRNSFLEVNTTRKALLSTLEDAKVAVMDRNSVMDCCLDDKLCKTGLGGWDFSLHRYFLEQQVDIYEADFLYLPFYQYCYNRKKFCASDSIQTFDMKLILATELKRARALLSRVGRNSLPLLVPLSHDFGACTSFNFATYGNPESFPYYGPLKDVVVIQPNGDWDRQCFDSAKDIVVPAFSTRPDFQHGGVSMEGDFGDAGSVMKSSERPLLAHVGFKANHSQRSPGLRRWLLDERNWQEPDRISLGLATSYQSYARALNESAFCIAPPGVVGWTGRLWESLYAGCIPVIIAENTLFPFEDVFDYSKFSLRFGFRDYRKIEQVLKTVSPERRDHLQAEGLRVRDEFRWPLVTDVAGVKPPSALHNLLRELAFVRDYLKKRL